MKFLIEPFEGLLKAGWCKAKELCPFKLYPILPPRN